MDLLESQTGVSKNIYIAVTLALLGEGNFLLRTEDATSCIWETTEVLNSWGVSYEVFNALELLGHVPSSEEAVTVISDVDKLSEPQQRELRDWVRKKRESIVIASLSPEFVLDKFLRREFWFQQNHEPGPPPVSTTSDLTNRPNTQLNSPANRTRLTELRTKVPQITMVPEMLRYIYDVIIHMRNHRLTYGGIPTTIIQDVQLMARCLCVLFNREFVIPTIVKVAVRKCVPAQLKVLGRDIDLLSSGVGGLSESAILREMMEGVSQGRWKCEGALDVVLGKVSVPL